jgi:sec-independent protein translocase protein TatA
MPFLGFWDLLILLLFVVLVFGSRRIPEAGRSLGTGIRTFKDAITARHERQESEEPSSKPALRERDTVL